MEADQLVIESLAKDLGLRVLGWREVPTDGSVLGKNLAAAAMSDA